MPARAKVDLLPADVREELDQEIVERGFARYVDLSEWLAERGYSIGKSALAEHGGKLEKRLRQIEASTRAAGALMALNPDEEGDLAAATLKAGQSALFDLFMAQESEDLKELSVAVRAAADAARANVTIGRERARIVKQALEEAAQRAAESADKVARESGNALPPEALLTIRRDVYGIHDAG